jgi:hypothetical protein
MYHYREWKDVTEFTDGCDLAQRPGVHLPHTGTRLSNITTYVILFIAFGAK